MTAQRDRQGNALHCVYLRSPEHRYLKILAAREYKTIRQILTEAVRLLYYDRQQKAQEKQEA